MNNKEFSKLLEVRTKKFGTAIIKFSLHLPKEIEFNVLRNQLTKSGTGIGANYREANRARSKADFRNRIKICESESSETLYWLNILKELNFENKNNRGKLHELIQGADEILSIFTTIGKNTRI